LARILLPEDVRGQKKGGHYNPAVVAWVLGQKQSLQLCGEYAAEAPGGPLPQIGHQDPGSVPRLVESPHHPRQQQVAQVAGLRRRGSPELRGLQVAPPASHLRHSRGLFAEELQV